MYKIADFIIEAEHIHSIAKRFQLNSDIEKQVDFNIKETDDASKLTNLEKKTKLSQYVVDALRQIAEWTPYYNAILVHSVCFDIDGAGVLFSAKSGTGKTTHLANWISYVNGFDTVIDHLNKYYGYNVPNTERKTDHRLTIVNGDKPIVRFFDEDFCKEKGLDIPDGTEFGIPYAYGTPWCGKERLGTNMRTPLKHICFIERSETNFVTKIDKNEAINRIMKQVYMPKDPVALANTLKLVDRLINSCELWIIHCNMEPESAKIAYDAIFKNH